MAMCSQVSGDRYGKRTVSRPRPGRPQLEEEMISSALALIEAGLPPTRAARQLGIGRSTLDRVTAERKAA